MPDPQIIFLNKKPMLNLSKQLERHILRDEIFFYSIISFLSKNLFK
jgi:hypothetical protein